MPPPYSGQTLFMPDVHYGPAAEGLKDPSTYKYAYLPLLYTELKMELTQPDLCYLNQCNPMWHVGENPRH